MAKKNVVSREAWLEARQAHLRREKEFTRLRDQLSRERRELPWVRVEKEYLFDGPDGRESLGDLFAGRSQLIVYHFMFGVDWEEGCPSCSFWADNFNGIPVHLAQRDITLLAVSKAAWGKLDAYARRMGWTFKWVSAFENTFNEDCGVSFAPGELTPGEKNYNFGTGSFAGEEAPGISVFFRDDDGAIYHTYSTYARGLDMLNGAYHFMDIAPQGRDEDGLGYSMAWLRRHDQYEG